MAKRGRHTEGFTLAELLMSVAIVLILAAIAFPSIVSAQNNMRMLELNNAAQSIANAAQAQMTAKKVSGTWVDAVKDGDSYRACFPAARSADVSRETFEGSSRSQGETEHVSRETLGSDEVAPPSASAAESSKRYMTADTAREQGIVPALAVEEAVRDADYIIEFDADTAQVTGVFYADGRSGFFGSTPASTNAAKTYYETEDASTDQAARMGHDPMIGYYGGTPAGATPEKALANPVIWVDEATGCLMVQDPNIAADGSAGSTTSTVAIENTGKNVAFSISGLSNGTTMVSLSTADDGSESVGFTNFAAAIKQQTRDNANVKGNVWAIDLNALSQLVAKGNDGKPAADDSQKAKLKQVFDACVAGDALTVSVETKDASRSCVPGTAAAHVEWPSPAGKLTMLITNPYSVVVAGEKNEAYIEPQVRSAVADSAHPSIGAGFGNGDGVVKDGLTVNPFYEDKDNHFRVSNANAQLKQENPQAGYQSYAGGWIASSSVRDDATYRLEGTVGAYNNHAYQIWELWIKRADTGECMRVGYLNDGKWEWGVFNQKGVNYDYRFLNDCFTWYGTNETGDASGTLAGTDTDTNNVISLRLDVQKFYAEAENHKNHGLADEDGNATVYVRTAPKASEVQAYFNKLAVPEPASVENPLKAAYLSGSAQETGSRTADTPSVTARAAFEGEFGASSSDVSWAVSQTTTAGFSQGSEYLSTAATVPVRVYYSIAPGVGFANIRSYDNGNGSGYLSGVLSTRLTNVSLWLYRGPSINDLAVMPPALLKNYKGLEFSCRQGSTYDFKITTQEDYRFYRALAYTVENGSAPPSQYVPHASASDESVAKIAAAENYETDDKLYTFKGWTTKDTMSGAELLVEADKLVSDYDGLSYQGTTLVASYDERKKVQPSLGMMYIETGTDKTGSPAYGYYGYIENNAAAVENLLSNEYSVTDGGYYVVVPTGSNQPKMTGRGDIPNYLKDFSDVLQGLSIEGGLYDCYRITVSDKDVGQNRPYDKYKLKNQTLSFKADIQTGASTVSVEGTYTVNFAFACAVETNEEAALSWGTSVSPWNVRLGRQFVGNLTAGSNNVQGKYAQYNCFIQTRNIDLADAPVVSTSKFTQPFLGSTYDGGGNSIFGIPYRLAHEGITGENQGRNGLFLDVGGESLIKNVNIVLDPTDEGSEYVFVSTHGSKLRFGLLVGSIDGDGADIQNCTVGVAGKETATLRIIKKGTGGEAYIGGLVGYASQANVSDLSVKNLRIEVVADVEAWKTSPAIGGIFGYGSQLNMSRSSVDGFACALFQPTFVNEKYPSQNTRIHFGGLVGSAQMAVISQNVKSNAVLQVPAGQLRDSVVAGRYVGQASMSAVAQNESGQVFVKYGDPSEGGETVEVTADVGVQ